MSSAAATLRHATVRQTAHASAAPAPGRTGASHGAATETAGAQWVRPTLTRLAVALSRRRAYAPTHPMVSQAEVALAEELIPLLAGGRILALGVAHRELLVDSVPLDAGGTVARDLAERLHRRGVGALTLQRGVTLEGLRALLGWLASEAEPDENDPPPSAVGIAVGRVAYDRLALSDDESIKSEVDALWRALAEAAFDDDHAYRGRLEDSTPEEVADAIRRHARDARYAERVGFVLGTLANHVSKAPDAVREVIGERLQRVMRRIGESSIASIVKAVGQGREQRRFLSAMVDVLPVKAVIEWLEIAGRATDQELSHHLLRILSKLSVHAGASRSRRDSHDTFREAARNLVHEWELGDPTRTSTWRCSTRSRCLARTCRSATRQRCSTPPACRRPRRAVRGRAAVGGGADRRRAVAGAARLARAVTRPARRPQAARADALPRRAHRRPAA